MSWAMWLPFVAGIVALAFGVLGTLSDDFDTQTAAGGALIFFCFDAVMWGPIYWWYWFR